MMHAEKKLSVDINVDGKIQEIASLVIDFECLAHENFRNDLNLFDLKVLKRCKSSISTLLKELGIYNVFLNFNDIQHGDSTAISPLKSLPLVKIGFTPRTRNDVDEDVEEIELDNRRVQQLIQSITSLLDVERKNSNVQKVRQKYAFNDDGVLITIPQIYNSSATDYINNLRLFSEDVRNLSLDDLMLSQQFSNFVQISHKNPFWLLNQQNHQDNSIKISLPNIESHVPMYFLDVLLQVLIDFILKKIGTSEEPVILERYHSINSSYISINLNFTKEV